MGFAASSALGGAAVNAETLFGARAVQGAFAAVLAPAGLSLLATTFTEPRERGRAFGVFAAVCAAGSAAGLIAGGLLTEYAGWRWCLYINVPVALLAVLGAGAVPRDRPMRRRGRFDVAGALLSLSGFAALVYGFNRAEPLGWGSAEVAALLTGRVLLLAAFAVVEVRAPDPLLPARVLMHRVRAGAFLAITLMFVAMFGFYLFMSYYLQTVLGYSPVQAGLALIVNALAALCGAMLIAGKAHGRVPSVVLVVPGLLAAAAGMLILTRLTADGADVFVRHLLPALVLTGLGLGCVMPPTAASATEGMRGHDIGAASAAYNAAQQLGAALGTALLNTLAAGATYLASHPRASDAAVAVHGYTAALTIASAMLLAAACLTVPLITARRA
ncbi:MFS transporter [Spirillospora sp. CA-142024]|uniref:MFS transporter n=1 Tax=Spirillospora sp. CA-142024 TaxID=3240036 RepID=UPI003D90F68B